MLSPEEYMNDEEESKILSPDEYMGTGTIPDVLLPEQYAKGLTKPKMEEQSFIAKHPNLYGAFGVAQSLIPYIKYIDPHERKRFAQLSTQKQTRELLLQNLETVALVAAPVITKGAVPIVARFLPKTYKALKFIKTPIKKMGELARTPAKEVAEAGLERTVAKAVSRGFSKIEKDIDEAGITTYRYFNEEGKEIGISLLKGKNILGVEVEPQFRRLGYGKHIGKHLESKGGTQAYRMSPEGEAMMKRARWKLKGDTAHHPIYEKPPVADDPVKKIISAIKEAKPIRKVQEQIYSQERSKRLGQAMAVGKRITGEKGFFAQLGKLKGELTKVEFESIRNKVGQKDMDALFDIVNKSIDVTGFQNITAKAALAQLLGSMGGRVPTEGGLALLGKIFPAELTKALMKKRPLLKRMTEAGFQLANIPRSIMASFDLSAPFRQGLFLVGRPKRFTQSFMKMFKQFGNEEAFVAAQEAIAEKSTYGLMKKSGLALTEMGERLAIREEAFMSQWAEKIPLVGRMIRASGRAHLGFLNKIRADVFEDLVVKAERLGLDPKNNMDLTKQIANFVNLASGRGSLGSLERSAVALNTFFFSPRLMASRLTLLNPIYYVRATPFVRKEALKSLFVLAGAVGTTLGLAKAGGVKIGTDYRSADFGKLRVGNTRIDIMGGFQQYIRAGGQLISGKYVSTTTGKVVTLGEGYRPLTRLEILYRQIESKEAPLFSFFTQMLKGQDIKGKKVSISKEIADRFKPMALTDIYEIAKENPDLVPLSLLSIFGIGLQTYKNRPMTIRGGIKPIRKQ